MHKTITRNATLVILLLGFAAAGLTTGLHAEEKAPENTAETTYVVYYFHTDMRCTSCERIEAWSHEAITAGFAEALKADQLQWQVRNVDKAEHEHFVSDFNLYTKSLVIAERRGGETLRFKNLEKVWQLIRDKDRFTDYVQEEIRAFMEKN